MHQKKNTILIIEDDATIRKLLKLSLEAEGYKVVESECGKEGMQLIAALSPELMILDLTLPDMHGKDVIKQVREWSQIPILVCSAHDGDNEIISCLSSGADDYIVKPFNPSVMLARVHANLRKMVTAEAGEPELANGGIRMDLVRHEVHLNGKKAMFTPKEYELLRYFLVHRGKMLTHRDILKAVWGVAHMEDMQYLRVYVRQLREKLESDMDSPPYIVTEPGIGYRMEMIAPVAPTPVERAVAES